MALIADSFHMLSDVAALVVAFLSVKVSSAIWIIKNLYKQMYTLYDWIVPKILSLMEIYNW